MHVRPLQSHLRPPGPGGGDRGRSSSMKSLGGNKCGAPGGGFTLPDVTYVAPFGSRKLPAYACLQKHLGLSPIRAGVW